MRLLLDTNVLFSALAIQRGVCIDLLRRCLARHELLISQHILDELRHHLTAKTTLSEARVAAAVDQLRSAARWVEPVALPPNACRDPDDIAVLGAAIAGSVDALVTGDRDLLSLEDPRGVVILSPRQALDLVKAEAGET